MNSKLKKGLIAGGIVLAFVAVVNIVKTDVHVERTLNIKADLEMLKSETSNFEKFTTWSPWADVDPNAKNEFKGEVGTVGAEFHWSGNDEVGTGYMRTTAISNERVDMDLVFTAPWESESKVYYTFVEKGEGVDVTWGMDSKEKQSLMTSWIIKSGVGSKYEKGLTSLKEKVEK